MNSILFFVGSFIRWLANNPRQSSIAVAYFGTIHGIAALTRFDSSQSLGLVFTILILAPFIYLICKGLPIDCLNSEAFINRERNSN